ncbi:MAG: hydrogenase formation protein HypD [Clostridia bacterium]|nr:hydrogenase formation protein HypD [Clostridia bacterium]
MPFAELLGRINAMKLPDVRLMEVCGTHTMAIARAGIKRMLPQNVELLSGPGCPVCVTPPETINAVLELSSAPNVTIATYGDMIRVPGGRRGDNLARRRALGASVEIVYSPMDAVEYAKNTPEREIVFIGVGFETTAPGTAAAIQSAYEENVRNFSVLSMLKLVEPALRALIASEGFNVEGFICPGHVASIIGSEGFRFLPGDYGLPAVVSGFEPEDILFSVYRLLSMIENGKPELENEYDRAVTRDGNRLAMDMIEKVFEPQRDIWRGLGTIDESGLGIRPEYAGFDAGKKFSLGISEKPAVTACRCGDVITGRLRPAECPLFGVVCVPEDPVGPCMVSSEGACAAAYKYQGI